MTNEKYQALVQRLISRTKEGTLDWKESAYPDVFQVSFPNYSLTLGQQRNREFEEVDYVVKIIDSEGGVIDTFTDVDVGNDYYRSMDELYQTARRQALGVDKALDEILGELGGSERRY